MKCTACGAALTPEDRFCGKCGVPRPQIEPRFAEAERRFAALRARYEMGELDDATFDANLQRLMIGDNAGGYWMLGAESGDWYRYEGERWVLRPPPLAEVPGAVRIPLPEPVVATPASPPALRVPCLSEPPFFSPGPGL